MGKILLRQGDIAVCLPGFTGLDGIIKDPLYGGAGYVDGMMAQIKESNDGSNIRDYGDVFVHWSFYNGGGVYARALRHATKNEILAFNLGIRNIYNIQQQDKTSFKISYITTSGEIKKEEVFAFTESEAVGELKDLKTVNYIMSDDDAEPVVIMERPQAVFSEKTLFDVVVVDAGPAKLGLVKLVKELLGLGLKESKDFVDSVPNTIFEEVSRERAEEVKRALEEAGATVDLK